MPLIKNVRARELTHGAVVMNLGDVRAQADAILVAARAEADRILAAARDEAKRLTDGAAERGEVEGFARGEAAGHAAGLEQGTAEGRAAAETATSERLAGIAEGWTLALDQVVASRALLREEARRDLLRLGLAIAERVLGRLPAHDPTVVVEQVEAAIAMLSGATRLRIRVHPEDLEAVERHFAGVVSRIREAPELDVTFETDGSIVRGGCVVSAGDGEVDSRLDVQVSRIVHGVFPELLEAPGEPVATVAEVPPVERDVTPTPTSTSTPAESLTPDNADETSVEDIARDLAALGFDDLDDLEPPVSEPELDPDPRPDSDADPESAS